MIDGGLCQEYQPTHAFKEIVGKGQGQQVSASEEGEREDEYCLRPPEEAAEGAGNQEGLWLRLPAGPTQSPGDTPTPTASTAAAEDALGAPV